jgi:DNA-binding LacI/PurR family transcriptional regulator
MTKITIRDVAKKAEVGIGTVSRVINNSPHVRAETRVRVLAAIQEIGFRPNVAARSLPRKTEIHNIGVITLTFVNYHSFAERLRGVQQGLIRLDEQYELMLYNVSSLDHFNSRISSIVQTHTAEGLLLVDLDLSDDQQEALELADIPFVGIGNLREKAWPCVGTDNVEGGYIATKHLLDYGHRRIMYVGDNFFDQYGFSTSQERYWGYERALKEHGLVVHDDDVQLGLHGYDAAKALTEIALQKPDLPTAIFAMSDIQALGCIATIREKGYRVPEDISVIGYDDLETAHHTGLTTVRQHLNLSGQASVEYLLQLLDRQSKAPPLLPPLEVMTRQTTRPLI